MTAPAPRRRGGGPRGAVDPRTRLSKRLGCAAVVVLVASVVIQLINHAAQRSAVELMLKSSMTLANELPRDEAAERDRLLRDLEGLGLSLGEDDVDVAIDRKARTWECEVRYSRVLRLLIFPVRRDFVVRHRVEKLEL